MQGLKIKWIISNMMRIMIACEIANKSENMENQKHRVFWENIVFFQVPAISWVLGSSGRHHIILEVPDFGEEACSNI